MPAHHWIRALRWNDCHCRFSAPRTRHAAPGGGRSRRRLGTGDFGWFSLNAYLGPPALFVRSDMYYLNCSFQLKMVLLSLAIVFNYPIHRRVTAPGSSAARNKVVACISIGLWVSVTFC